MIILRKTSGDQGLNSSNNTISTPVSEDLLINFETVGKRQKFWYESEHHHRCMFKRNEYPGEDWAEILASEIASLLGIPHANYDFAHLVDADENEIAKGVITQSFVGVNQSLSLGNTFLLDQDPEYDLGEGNYKVRRHTIGAISDVIAKLEPPIGVANFSAAECYASYLFLDVLIANQDRHHENWGVIQWDGVNYLAPTYDHASSFARNVRDVVKQERMSTNDRGYKIDTFAARAESAINADEGNRRLTTRAALNSFCQYNSVTIEAWQSRLMNIQESQLSDIIGRIPDQYMSEVTRNFTLSLLQINKAYLLDL